MKFDYKKNSPLVWATEEPYYMLNNGYLDLVLQHLADPIDKDRVLEAAEVLEEFFESAFDNGILGEA